MDCACVLGTIVTFCPYNVAASHFTQGKIELDKIQDGPVKRRRNLKIKDNYYTNDNSKRIVY